MPDDIFAELAKKSLGIKTPTSDVDVSDLLTKMKGGVLQTENSGNYQGPRNKRTGAVGGFQVLPDNIPSWTRKYYKKQLTPDEFERDTAAQDAVFDGEMGKYLRAARKRGVDDRTAIRMGAAQWYGGEGAIDRYDDPKRFRPNEASFQEYTNLVADRSLKGQLAKKQSNVDIFTTMAQQGMTNPAKPSEDIFTTLAQQSVAPTEIDDPYAQIGATTQSNATPEKIETLDAQIGVASDLKNMARSGVFFPNDGTNRVLEYANRLDQNQWGVFPDSKHNGHHLINLAKAKKWKLRTAQDIQTFIDKNPDALKTLGIAVEDVGNNTRGTAVLAKDPKTGTELATGVVTNPISAVEQAQNYKDQFPNAEIEVTDTDVVTDARKQGEEIDRLAPTSMTGEADDIAPVYPVAPQKPSLPISRSKQPTIAPKGQPKATQQTVTPVSGKMPATPDLTEKDYQDYFTANPDLIDTPANRNAFAEMYKANRNFGKDVEVSAEVGNPTIQGTQPSTTEPAKQSATQGYTDTTYDIPLPKTVNGKYETYIREYTASQLANELNVPYNVALSVLNEHSFVPKDGGTMLGEDYYRNQAEKYGTQTNTVTASLKQKITSQDQDIKGRRQKADTDFEARKQTINASLSGADRDLEEFRLRGMADIDAGLITPEKQTEAYDKLKKDVDTWKEDKGFLGIWNQEDWIKIEQFLGGRPDTGNRPASESYQPTGLGKEVKSPKDYFNKAYADMQKQYGSASNWVQAKKEEKKRFQNSPMTYLMKAGEAGVGGAMKAPFTGAASALKAIAIGSEALDKVTGTDSKAEDKYSYILAKGIEDLAEGIKVDKDFKGGNAEMLGNVAGQVIVQAGLGIATGGALAPALFGAAQGAAEQYEKGTAEGLDGWTRLGKALVGGLIEAPDYFVFKSMLKGGNALNKIGVIQNLKATVERGLIAKGILAPVAEKMAVAATDGFVAELIAKGGFKELLGKGLQIAKTKGKVGVGEAIQEGTTRPLNDLWAYISYDRSPERWESATSLQKSDLVEGVGGFFGGIVGAGLADIQARAENLSPEAVSDVETFLEQNKDVFPKETYNDIQTAIKKVKSKEVTLKPLVPDAVIDTGEYLAEVPKKEIPKAELEQQIKDSTAEVTQGIPTEQPVKKKKVAPVEKSVEKAEKPKFSNKPLKEVVAEGETEYGGVDDFFAVDEPTKPVTDPKAALKAERASLAKLGYTLPVQSKLSAEEKAEIIKDGVLYEKPVKSKPTTNNKVNAQIEKEIQYFADPDKAREVLNGKTLADLSIKERGLLPETKTAVKQREFTEIMGRKPKESEMLSLSMAKTADEAIQQLNLTPPSEIKEPTVKSIPTGTIVYDANGMRGEVVSSQGKDLGVAWDNNELEVAPTTVDAVSTEKPSGKVKKIVQEPWQMTAADWDALSSSQRTEIHNQWDDNRSANPSHSNYHAIRVISAMKKGLNVPRNVLDGLDKSTRGWDAKKILEKVAAGEIFPQTTIDWAKANVSPKAKSETQAPLSLTSETQDYTFKNPPPDGLSVSRDGKTGTIQKQDGKIFVVKPDGTKAGWSPTWKPVDETMMQAAKSPDEWYSTLGKALEQKMPARASADQVRGIIKDAKQEEREWLGIDQYLDENPNVTKADILQFIRDNQVQVEEVVKESDSFTLEDAENEAWEKIQNRQIYVLEDGAYIERTESGGWFELRHNGRGRKFSDLEGALDTAVQEGLLNLTEKSDTKFSQYVLPGGENYKELLLTMPDRGRQTVNKEYPPLTSTESARLAELTERVQKEGMDMPDADVREMTRLSNKDKASKHDWAKDTESLNFKSSHFSEPNILAHIRFDDRTVDGKKVLHIAEIQSDWHQAGRKKGYKQGDEPLVGNFHSWLEAKGIEISEAEKRTAFADDQHPLKQAWVKDWNESRNGFGRVPNAPFKKSWQELAFKKALRYAVENGYDAVSWDTGETQAERYDLSKQVKFIQVLNRDIPNAQREVVIYPNDGEAITLQVNQDGKVVEGYKEFIGKSLDDVIGKEMAEKAMKADKRTNNFTGNDLKVGGEGMKGFYDKILPTFVNKYTKKWGGKVERGQVPSGIDTMDQEIRTSVDVDGLYTVETGSDSWTDLTEQEADAKVAELKGGQSPAHIITITPAMRESVMKGQQMFRAVSELDAMQYAFQNAKTLATKTLVEKSNFTKNARIAEGGVIAVDQIPEIELIRRIMGEGTQFYGVMADPNKVAKFNETLDKMIAHSDSPNLKRLKRLVTTALKHDGTVIFAMSEETVPEEKAHRALYGNRQNDRASQIAPEVQKSIAESDVFKNAKKFQDTYKSFSEAGKVEEFAVKASLGQWNDLGITSEADKFEAMSMADDFYRSYAETNKGKLNPEQILNTLSTEIAYAQEFENYKNQEVRGDEKENKGTDANIPVEPAKGKESGNDVETSGEGKPDELKSPKLASRTPGKSGLEFDPDTAEEAKAEGKKVAAMSRHLGREEYYTPQGHDETDLKAQQLVANIGVSKAIEQALYGKPSAESNRVLQWELKRLSAVAEAQKELGNDAEYAAVMEQYADLVAGATMRMISTGREVESYKLLEPLTPVGAQMVAQRLQKLAFGDDAKLTPDQTKLVEDLARQLQKAVTQVEKSKIIIAEQQRIIDNVDEAKPRVPLNRQEALLDSYKKKEKKILAELEKRFPNSPMFNGETASSETMMMAIKASDVVLDPETEGLLRDYTIGQVLTNRTYDTVIAEIQDISGASLEQAKDIHAMAMDEIRGAKEPQSEEAKKRVQVRKEHYAEADKHAHPEKAAEKAVKLAEGNLKRQIENLEKEIATGQKEVKVTNKATSPEIERLKRERDALKVERDTLLGTGLTDQQRVDRAIKAVRKSIDKTTEKITANDLAVVRKQPVDSDALTALRAEQKTLRSILNDMRREAKKTQTKTSGLSKIAQQAVEFYPEDYEFIAVINYLTQQKPKTINEALNYLQNTFGFHITEAKEIAIKAQEAIKRIKASNKVAKDKAKGIIEEERVKLDEAQTKATKEALKLNRFLKNFGQNPNAIKRFNNDFRAKLISNFGTQLFNAIQSTTVSTPATIALDMIEAGLRGVGINFGEATDINALDALRVYAFLRGSNRQIAEQALANFPEQYFDVHSGLMGDIEIELLPLADTKTNKASKAIHWWFDKNDILNRKLAHLTGAKWQEMLFRNAVVASTFDNIIRKRTGGKSNLSSAMKDGTFKDIITENDATRAAKRALEVTFASQIDDPLGKWLKQKYDGLDNYLPVLMNPITYARFTYTATKVMVLNPLTFGAADQLIYGIADKKNKTQNRPEYNTREIAKGALAWSGVAVAYGLMSMFGGDDDKWYTIYPLGKNGPIWDVRRTYPLSSMFYMAHLIKSAEDGAPPPTITEFLAGFASLELDYFQYGPAAELYGELGNAYSTQSMAKVPQASAALVASYFSGLLRFFKPAKDILAQAWDKEAAVKEYGDGATDKVIEQLSKSLPLVNMLSNAPVKKDIAGKEVLMPFPLGRMVGINLVHPSFVSPEDSPATKWANKLWKFEGSGGMTAEERKAYNARKAIQNAWRTGNKIKVEQALQNMDTTLTPKSKQRLIDELKYSELGAKVKYNFGDNAKDIDALKKVWNTASSIEKDEIKKILATKDSISAKTRELFK